MKYYYKILVKEGIEDSLRSIKAPDAFIEDITKNSELKDYINQGLDEFYVAYDVEKIRKGKSPWTFSIYKELYRVNWNFRGEIHPHRKDKISQLKKLWEEN